MEGSLTILALAMPVAFQASVVLLDPHASQGTWEGWGTSLCWMGKAFGGRDDLADYLFTTKTVGLAGVRLPGLGLNVVRYNAGACSWNEVDGRKMVVGKVIQPFRQMEGFWLDPKMDRWDWSLDEAQRKMMQGAKRRGADRFELFSNSPMWWMCRNDNPSGAADAKGDNLREDEYGRFAAYLAEVAKRAKEKWGVAFTTVEPFNEPASPYWGENGKQEGCHFSPPAQSRLLPLLRRELDARRLGNLPIAASDETSMSDALGTWKSLPPKARALVAQVNVHGYEGEGSPRRELRAMIGDKPLWLSEHGERDGTGLSMARNLHRDFRDLRPKAWCYWQPLDGGGWGFIEADLPKTRLVRANPKAFVMAQYTRHVRPGMTILRADDLGTIAAYDPKRHRLAIVVETGEEPTQKRFDLSRFAKVGRSAARWTTEPKGTARYAKGTDVRLDGKTLDVTLPSNSIQTFEIDGVSTQP